MEKIGCKDCKFGREIVRGLCICDREECQKMCSEKCEHFEAKDGE